MRRFAALAFPVALAGAWAVAWAQKPDADAVRVAPYAATPQAVVTEMLTSLASVRRITSSTWGQATVGW
jgi:hypothetical protein